ncbi:MAG TPA: Yip1 family protein [Candidatus Dormibacteraeota bacterium]|nr:Yip1 family protein [Candidatus Dormibacteraeota bacterium]
MIKALLLIVAPSKQWEQIYRAQRSLLFVLVVFLLPLLIISSAAEGYGLMHWGKWQGPLAHAPKLFSLGETVVFEVIQFVLSLAVVLINAGLILSTGGTFHGRHTFAQGFTTIAYGLSPLFLFRLLNASSDVPSWAAWGVGILFSLAILYHGVPRIMQPDPAHAFGLYLITSLLVIFTTGLEQLITASYLQGKFPKLDELISHAAAKLPF